MDESKTPEEQSLVVVQQREVTFYGDQLVAVKGDNGHIYVSIRHLADALGLARQGQVARTKRNDILFEGYREGIITTPPGPDGHGGGPQQTALLRVDLVPLWLAGVDTRRVKDEIRPKLQRYQREAAKILWEAFQEGRLTAEPALEELLETDTPAVQAYKMLSALTQLARNQIFLEAQITAQGQQLASQERRLEAIEVQLGRPGAPVVSQEQAMQISQAVKAVAMELSKRSGRNEYGGVYGEFYRKFEITSYKLLPAGQFERAMNFLTEWYTNLTGKTPF